MQIYGDSARDIDIAAFAGQVLRQAPSARGSASQRAFLIACGQLEQLISDAIGAPPSLRADSIRATDHAAAAFYASWAKADPRAPRVDWRPESEIEQAGACIAELASCASTHGLLKLPEGFAFYAVYPEQYCAAAVRYLDEHGQSSGMTHVIGLRSIGTTLSALVAVVLKAAGIEHCRYTVRPHGHPFQRELELPRSFAADDSALIVDEGPGLSGSSFFAAARALEAARVPARRCVYFCAHREGPGAMASAEIRSFWRSAERYAAAEKEPVIAGEGALGAALAAELTRVFASDCSMLRDLSCGQWRKLAYTREAEWPPAYPQFERPKYLAELADGRRVLLKYYGQVLRADATGRWRPADQAAMRAVCAGGNRVVTIHGYVARPWVDGRLLSRVDKRPRQCERLAAFLARRTWTHAHPTADAADAYVGCSGRLAPEEWIRLASGRVVKLPETLQGYDHTAIDHESLGWDIAGASVEWALSGEELERLLSLFGARLGIEIDARQIRRHQRRYAEFQAEKAWFCARSADADEARRLTREAARYAAYSEGAAL